MKISSFSQLIDALLLRKVSFVSAFFVVFIFSYAVLAWADFLPEPVYEVVHEETAASVATSSVAETPIEPEVEEEVATTTEAVVTYLLPDTIRFDALERSVTVLNPTSRTVEDLDAALLYGVVRHPDSAALGQTGTVFILGHSSYLPTVLNPNFQAFNGIQNLQFGDVIRLYSGAVEYVYRVDKVYKASASSVTVPIAGDVSRLVLATCNSFGSTDDRFIVEADLLEVNQ
jgi:hypothetical protein